MLACTGIASRGWSATKISNHTVVANIARMSDLVSLSKFEAL